MILTIFQNLADIKLLSVLVYEIVNEVPESPI